MENGYVILGIIALLFLSMYGYAYFSVSWEKIKERKSYKRDIETEALRREESIQKQAVIDERVCKFNARKEQIQYELMLLEKMKEKQRVS